VDGGRFEGASLAGKPAVFWFWAPWCTVCRGEAPDIDALQRRYGDRVSFVGVGSRGPVGDMREFVAETGLGAFPHVADADGAVWSRFGVAAQPAFAFAGRDGTVEVVPGKLGAAELAARLEALVR
jgi:thiol-disulfide isomerase/thioredoxin